jgi:tRNA threonylcarbamoyladenosine modification (KEOPS) complex  Pcc1 subunit
MTDSDVSMKPPLDRLTIRIKAPPAFGLRMTVVRWLLVLAAWVSPVTLTLVLDVDSEPHGEGGSNL